MPLHSRFSSTNANPCDAARDGCAGHEPVKQYLFEAAGKYYVYDGATGVVCQITRPNDIEGILGELKEKGGLDMVALNVGKG